MTYQEAKECKKTGDFVWVSMAPNAMDVDLKHLVPMQITELTLASALDQPHYIEATLRIASPVLATDCLPIYRPLCCVFGSHRGAIDKTRQEIFQSLPDNWRADEDIAGYIEDILSELDSLANTTDGHIPTLPHASLPYPE